MKPIVQDERIVAKLGGRELTREQLRRLPESLRNKVEVFPKDDYVYKDDSEMERDFSTLIERGYLEAKLDGKVLTKEEWENLPEEDKKKRVTFRNTKEGEEYITGRNRPKVIETEWATKEELATQLEISSEETENTLKHHIEMGFIEEKDGKYRINNSDGQGTKRIKEYIQRMDKFKDKGKLSYMDAIETMVKGGIYDAIQKGWIEFQDGLVYTAEEWKALSGVEQEKIGIRLTEKGKREIEDGNPLKIYDELAEKKLKDGGFNLVRNIYETDYGVDLELTEEGERVKMLGEAMGISAKKVFQTILKVGLTKQLSGYMVVDEEKVEGDRRIERIK